MRKPAEPGEDIEQGRLYDAFISYSWAADEELAPALQRGLHRFAKPWYRRRALNVFRDDANLAADPGLWSSISRALDQSRFFILLASPEAARSFWVRREVKHWLASNPPRRMMIAVTSGDIGWDRQRNVFDAERSTCLPPQLVEVFDERPRWVDFREVRGRELLSGKAGAFSDAVASLAAPMHGRSKGDMVGEDVRRHRQTKRHVFTAVAVLALLSVVAAGLAIVATNRGREAERERRTATARLLQVQADTIRVRNPHVAMSLSIAANEVRPSEESRIALTNMILGTPYFGTLARHEAPIALLSYGDDDSLISIDTAAGIVRWRMSDRRPTAITSGLAVRPGRRWDPLDISSNGKVAVFGSRSTKDDSDEFVRYPEVVVLDIAGPSARTVSSFTDAAYGPIAGAAVSSDGRLLGLFRNDRVKIFDTTETKPVQVRELGADLVGGIAFTPDDKRLAVIDSGLSMWDVASRRSAPVSQVPDLPLLTGISFSADGRQVAVEGESGAVVVFEVSAAGKVELFSVIGTGATGGAGAHAFVEGSTPALAVAGGDGLTQVFPVRRGEVDEPTTVFTTAIRRVTAVVASPDGQSLLAGGSDGDITVWRLTGPPRPAEIPLSTMLGQKAETAVSSVDGRLMATDDGSGRTTVWDVADPQRIKRLSPPFEGAPGVFLGQDRIVTTSVGAKGKATDRLWDLTDPVHPVLLGPPLPARPEVAIDDRFVLASDFSGPEEAGTGRILDLRDPRRPVLLPRRLPADLWFPQPGLAVDGDNGFQLWDLSDPARPVQSGTQLPGRPFAITPDKKIVALSRNDSSGVELWDVSGFPRAAPIAELKSRSDVPATAVGFFGKQPLAVVGGGDGSVTLWNIADPHRPRQVGAQVDRGAVTEPADAEIGGFSFFPDGRTFATNGDDDQVTFWTAFPESGLMRLGESAGGGAISAVVRTDGRRFWDLSAVTRVTQDPVALACLYRGPELTDQDWSVYALGVDPVDTC